MGSCTYLREHGINVINFEKKKRLPLTKEELKSHWDTKLCYICGEIILKKFANLQVNIEAQKFKI